VILVIGWGSPLRGDDAIGQYLAMRLAALRLDWQVIATCQLTPELAAPICDADLVAFIDAHMDGEAGAITCEAITPEEVGSAFTHYLTPASLLAAAQLLYGARPLALLITVGGVSFGLGDDLSPIVREALPRITERVEEMIAMNIFEAPPKG
jgi:hydrogenase maturation protease